MNAGLFDFLILKLQGWGIRLACLMRIKDWLKLIVLNNAWYMLYQTKVNDTV